MTRKLAAILVVDMVGYSRLMAADEAGTLARLKALRAELIDPEIASNEGRIVKAMGDGLLAVFDSVVSAVEAAAAVQKAMALNQAGVPPERRIALRIGVHLGDIIIDGDDIFGDGVNLAARLEGIATPGGICISEDAWRQVRGKVELHFDDLGEKELKNIPGRHRVYGVNLDPARLTPEAFEALTGERLELPDKPSIAVLPFENMSGDAEQEYFADGIAEDILYYAGRFEQSLTRNRKAMRLSPYFPDWFLVPLGESYRGIGKMEKAREVFEYYAARAPGSLLSQTRLARIHAELGNEARAKAVAETVLSLDPGFSVARFLASAPLKEKAEREKFAAGLLKAGLPE